MNIPNNPAPSIRFAQCFPYFYKKKCRMNYKVFTYSLIFIIISGISNVFACTNLIVTKGATSDHSVMITYAADSHTRYGTLGFYPAADHKPGDLCKVYHYENGKLLGTIPEVSHTYSVIQFMNENQVAIGETTWGGLDSLTAATRSDSGLRLIDAHRAAALENSPRNDQGYD